MSTATNFEPLRNMESFTKDMFNRIIAFQEKEHGAWNTNLAFSARIKDLPLHNLIFSNPDRDPTRHNCTVAAFYPLREEMQKISFYVAQLADKPVLCDLYPGNGFIGSLLGRETVNNKSINVIASKDIGTHIKPNQIESFFDTDHFSYRNEPPHQLHYDAALISWPLAGSNPSAEQVLRQTKLLIYIFTEHVNESTQQRQTGSEEMLTTLTEQYRLIDRWAVTRPKDILHAIWPDMTPSIAETRYVHIYAHNSIGALQPAKGLLPVQSYDWERDLQMALLALQAKQQIQNRGFPT